MAIALALVVVGLVRPALSPVSWVVRRVAAPATELEPVAPVRFAQLLAAGFLGLALLLIAAGAGAVGWTLVGLVAALGLLSAATGLCVGCEAYRLLLAARGSRGDADLRADLGLRGEGPWLVRVDLSEHPRAASLPVRSVPAALAVGPDGRLVAARAGRLGRPGIAQVLAAL